MARERQVALSRKVWSIGWVRTTLDEGGEKLDRRRAKKVLNPCSRKSKVRTETFLREKLISDHGLFSSYEGQKGAANGNDSWNTFQGCAGLGQLDAGSSAGFTSLRPSPPRTSVFQCSLLLYGVWS